MTPEQLLPLALIGAFLPYIIELLIIIILVLIIILILKKIWKN